MSLIARVATRIRRLARGMYKRRNYPVAVHLIQFAAGTLMPVLLIVTFMLIDAARRWRDDALLDARVIVHHLNATIEVEIEKAIAVGQTLAIALVLDDNDHALFDALARDAASRLGENIVVRDLSGQQIVNTSVPPGNPLPVSNDSVLATDRLAVARKAPAVSDLIVGTVRKLPAVNAVIPAIKGTEVTWLIGVSLSPERLSQILAAGLPDGLIAGVVGRDGRLIARSLDNNRFIGTTNRPFLDLATAPEGTWAGTTREGIPVAGVYIRSPLYGWVVSVAVPETILRAPARWAIASLGGLAAAALILSLYFGWRLSRRIALPIRDLVFRARELGAGRRTAVRRSSVDEINEVTDALLVASVELDRRAEAAKHAADMVRANEERLQLVQDTAGIGTVDWNLETGRAICSPRYYELFSLAPGTTMQFADFIQRVHPVDRKRLEQSHDRLFGLGGPFEEEFRILTPNGGERWIYARGRLDLEDGRPVRLLGAGIDITDRKRSEDHLRFLLREISHRSKNLLAVIQGMAGQTAKSAETVDVFKRRFGERLMGLAASHDLLVNQDWMGASVENLVRGQLSPFIDDEDLRVQMNGPAVDLTAEAAQALGLGLHELATNSLKYGALSDQAGKVEIIWGTYEPGETGEPGEMGASDDPSARQNARRFRMEWNEHTVVPVSPPSHKGFGRIVIEHTVEVTLGGTVTLDFPPGGLRWRIDAPASCLAPVSRVGRMDQTATATGVT